MTRNPVTVTVAYQVVPGREADCHSWGWALSRTTAYMSAVFPPVLLFNLTVLRYLGNLNPLIRTLLLCLCVTALVTWILMPRLQRFFKKRLYPPLQAFRGRHTRRTA
ncbi:hypothetical protein [Streptomyces sp. Ru72]|uniref:hypothetical protein n=1 Tax=Streptomyces sp. Ru72 TaxID=2080747 RepID=UPI000CDD80F2|nr:hypothetical protein [Streptomyces sp. Ru72]POX42049.1 hypothetical protein C3488_37090 [Streptomyces sp. Ru72]